VIVTPGVRMDEEEVGDQKRVARPSQAIADGANFIVMGRSLLSQKQPAEAAKRILESLSQALS
jgi:orotidine-5'-phosphate decarboxylase